MALRRRRPAQAQELHRVYREHVDAVFGFFAYSIDRTSAEDLTASTFERVVRSWDRFDPRRASERTWILAIARNLLTDHFRSASHRRSTSTDDHPELLDRGLDDRQPLDQYPSDQEVSHLLKPLASREREVLALRYAADLSMAEIAELLGLTVANVQQISSRALRRLRERAESDEDSAPSATGNA